VNNRPLVVRLSLIVGSLLFVGYAAFATQDVDAACGGPFIEDWLDQYDFSHANNIVLGRLIERDADGRYHFETLTVYRGSVASPIEADGVVEAGECIVSVEPGRRFIYVSGGERFGPYDLIFTHLPDYGWMVQPPDGFRSLDSLLTLVGVLPDTSTSAPLESQAREVGFVLGGFVVALLVAWMKLGSRNRSNLAGTT
jgi:hypothetical protein